MPRPIAVPGARRSRRLSQSQTDSSSSSSTVTHEPEDQTPESRHDPQHATAISAEQPRIKVTMQQHVQQRPKRSQATEIEPRKRSRRSASSTATRYSLRETRARNATIVATVTPKTPRVGRSTVLYVKTPEERRQSKDSLPENVVDIFQNYHGEMPSEHSVHRQQYGYKTLVHSLATEQRQMGHAFGDQALGRQYPFLGKKSCESKSKDTMPYQPQPWSLLSPPNLLDSNTEPMGPHQPWLTPHMRSVLVHWLAEVAVEYNCSPPAWHGAVTLLDAMLAVVGKEETSNDDDDEEESSWESVLLPHGCVPRAEFQALGWYVCLLVPPELASCQLKYTFLSYTHLPFLPCFFFQ